MLNGKFRSVRDTSGNLLKGIAVDSPTEEEEIYF
jgi:hypothetical protein